VVFLGLNFGALKINKFSGAENPMDFLASQKQVLIKPPPLGCGGTLFF